MIFKNKNTHGTHNHHIMNPFLFVIYIGAPQDSLNLPAETTTNTCSQHMNIQVSDVSCSSE